MRLLKLPLLLVLSLGILSPPVRAETVLNEVFWVELEPLVLSGEGPLRRDEAILLVLEEARFVFSAMIYGFTFSYTPSDRARRVEEEFELDLYYQIPLGDPQLFVQQTHREGSRLLVRLRYGLQDFQESWYQGLQSNLFRAAGGLGEASYFDGVEEKKTAIIDGVKNAVREHARTRIGSKPQNIRGMAALDGAPRISIESGRYRARCNVKLRIDEVRPYRAF